LSNNRIKQKKSSCCLWLVNHTTIMVVRKAPDVILRAMVAFALLALGTGAFQVLGGSRRSVVSHSPRLRLWMGTSGPVAEGVPVIDINPLWQDEESAEKLSCVNAIDAACREWGFFQVSNHGVPEETISKMYEQMRSFFYLPLEEKYKIKRTSENSRGFYDDELTKQTKDWKQGLDLGSALENCEPGVFQDGWNQWPAESVLPGFKSDMERYYSEMEVLSAKLMEAIACGLGVPEKDFFVPHFDKHTSYLRLNYYPVCPDPSVHLGINRHTDAGALTVLLQDSVSALQVNKDGDWIGVQPKEKTFTINVGDMLQVWSNGQYQAPEHRVLANPTLERFSAPFFYNPNYSSDCTPLESCLDANGPRYSPVNWGVFRQRRFEGDFADVGTEIQISDFLLSKN